MLKQNLGRLQESITAAIFFALGSLCMLSGLYHQALYREASRLVWPALGHRVVQEIDAIVDTDGSAIFAMTHHDS